MAEAPIQLEKTGPIAHLVLSAPPRNEIDGRFLDTFVRLTEDTLPGLDAQGLVVRGRGRHHVIVAHERQPALSLAELGHDGELVHPRIVGVGEFLDLEGARAQDVGGVLGNVHIAGGAGRWNGNQLPG